MTLHQTLAGKRKSVLWHQAQVQLYHAYSMDQMAAIREVAQAELELCNVETLIARQERIIGFAQSALEQIGPTPGTRLLANARTRIEEGLLWLKEELGTPQAEDESQA